MTMAITMRMVARIFVFATEVTQGPLSSLHYTHIKRPPKSRCAICDGFEDTTKMSPRSRGTCLGDLSGDRHLSHIHIQIVHGHVQVEVHAWMLFMCMSMCMCTSEAEAEAGSRELRAGSGLCILVYRHFVCWLTISH
jgi:hypothetical protein